MFAASTYRQRRTELLHRLKSGVVLLPGNTDAPMNYTDNVYPFRQDSTFLYYFGLDIQNLVGLLDVESGDVTLFGDDPTMDHIVWMGPQPTVQEMAAQTGVAQTAPLANLVKTLAQIQKAGRAVHFLPTYRGEQMLQLVQWLNPQTQLLPSTSLIRAIVAQREIKTAEEIAELEQALEISYTMHTTAMRMAKTGVKEREIKGRLTGIAEGQGTGLAFPIISTVHGETLHNHHYDNTLAEGQFLLVDGGAASLRHYASDITRTTPVGGIFSAQQAEVYSGVLSAQTAALEMMQPGVPFERIHLKAALTLTQHLQTLGLMKGDPEEAVAAGAHALFFPHGLGHALGLDVHDMESLGEDFVGYTDDFQRHTQFGIRALRFGKPLTPGHVLTVEPGCYFIPALVNQWQSEGRHDAFIAYEKIPAYYPLGGVRLEDNVLVTQDGIQVLGRPIPKTLDAVEATAQSKEE